MKSYVIGSFFKLQQSQKALEMEVSSLMDKAELVCIALDLPPSIRKSIRQYCLFQWSKARDVSNREVVLKTFQPDLQKKTKEQLFLPVIQANEWLLTGVSAEFTLQLCDQLAIVNLLPSEMLFVEQDAPQDISFLDTGTLMLTRQEQLIRYVRSDRPNETTVVGEVSFLLDMPHLYSVRSRAGVESTVLRVSKQAFDRLMQHLDTDADQLMQNAAQSMQLTLNGSDAKREYLADGRDDTELFVQMREAVRSKLLKRTSHMSSAFIRAASEGNVEQVELLLRKRVQVNTANCDGRTAMHLAAAEGRDAVMKVLIEAEGNVNLQDRWKGSPLKDAVLAKNGAVTELLIEQQADLNLDDPATALCDAASSGNLVALKELIEVKINPDSGDYDLRTPLHLAASEGKLEVISFLLESKANPNFKDRWGGTALEDAIQNNHTVVAQLIFSKRGQLRQELAAGWLCDAASAGNIVKLQQLAENSVDVNLADYDSRTALHLAATEGQLLAVSFLLGTARANSSPQDRWLSTPLQDAIRAGHVHCARLLAFAGAALGDSATDEDRQELRELYAEDMASSSDWGHIQVFQRRMTDLQQRVARLLVAVLKGRARPEVFDAEASARFNRQLIGAVLRQCPQIAEQMVGMSGLLRKLNTTALAPMSAFLALLQDCIDCTQQSKWWAWHDKQGQTSQRLSKRQDKGSKEAKLDKSTGMVTKLMVSTMGICSILATALSKASALIQERVNKLVDERHLKTKDGRIGEYLARTITSVDGWPQKDLCCSCRKEVPFVSLSYLPRGAVLRLAIGKRYLDMAQEKEGRRGPKCGRISGYPGEEYMRLLGFRRAFFLTCTTPVS
ncbi:SKOR [Symbiodinium pilosum]|uniref:SKOR protein n=1 Tax=Symbiodinium pilosum TaxID=2952 RepID=A0A812PP56_SYMPI|nr:SKOR [Symbiodinium pilosum]